MISTARVMALLPAYNAVDFIQPVLDSLSAQQYENFRVLISVDLGTDNTFDICQTHAERDPRFKVIRQTKRRLGYSGNCNFLLRNAKADYVMFAFHDDTLAPTFVPKLAATLDNNKHAIMAFPDMHLTKEDGSTNTWQFTDLEGTRDPLQRGIHMLRRPNLWWVPNHGMFRLALARKTEGIRPHRAGEFSVDWPWLFRLSLLGDFVRMPEVLCFKTYMTSSLSRSWDFSRKEWREATASCIREIWNSHLPTNQRLQLSKVATQVMARDRKAAEQADARRNAPA